MEKTTMSSSSPLYQDEEEATPLVTTQQQHKSSYNTTTNNAGKQYHLSVHQQQEEEDHDTIYDVHSNATTTTVTVGRLLLLLTAFLYGTLNVTLRLVYALPDPPSASALSCTRGWLATLCFAPFLMHSRPKPTTTPTTAQSTSSIWRVAGELAVWNFGAQGLANLGLLTVPSARAAFLTQTSVVMTPVISFFAGHAVHRTAWIACVVALFGLVLLSYDTSAGVGHFGAGDLLCLGGALSWSTYIFRLSICQGYNEIQLQAIKTLLLAMLYTFWFTCAVSIQGQDAMWLGYANIVAWLLLLYSAFGPGTLADILQNKGQLTVSAAEGNVILSMEPVFTALLGLFLLSETLSWQEMMGGGLIITAAVIATR